MEKPHQEPARLLQKTQVLAVYLICFDMPDSNRPPTAKLRHASFLTPVRTGTSRGNRHLLLQLPKVNVPKINGSVCSYVACSFLAIFSIESSVFLLPCFFAEVTKHIFRVVSQVSKRIPFVDS